MVKNIIPHNVSSGFVEENNNIFKLPKCIVYRRSGLANPEKKCKVAFMPGCKNFNLDFYIKQAGAIVTCQLILYIIISSFKKEPYL
ncbi:MAG: hypothetical protein K2K35_01600 [Lachnospiraceae bacterium]|nr:hypothetical protein [Lachnospiraceae bacterium]